MNFPLYESLSQEIRSRSYVTSDIKKKSELLAAINDSLSTEWSRYLSTVIGLVITRFYELNKGNPSPPFESESCLVYDTDSFDPELQQMICVLIDRCVEN